MSNKTKDILDEILDVEESTAELVEKKPDTLAVKRDNTLDDVDTDYKYQRENFYNLIERGQDAIDGILEVAKQSDHPRSYEVAGNLISQVADITEKLGKLQSAMKRLKEVPNNAPKNVTNALYVGSTAELQKLLKKDKEK
nr:terminase small subunit [uncultured Mediterranean phage uvMED]